MQPSIRIRYHYEHVTNIYWRSVFPRSRSCASVNGLRGNKKFRCLYGITLVWEPRFSPNLAGSGSCILWGFGVDGLIALQHTKTLTEASFEHDIHTANGRVERIVPRLITMFIVHAQKRTIYRGQFLLVTFSCRLEEICRYCSNDLYRAEHRPNRFRL